jgi:hypothetical protein
MIVATPITNSPTAYMALVTSMYIPVFEFS